MTNRILILGGSGTLGNTIYKELLSYFDVYATYHSQKEAYNENQVFFQFDTATDSIFDILRNVEPQVIISCIKGSSESLLTLHKTVSDYIWATRGKIIFISSASVFDGRNDLPAYENDPTLAQSKDGKEKIAIERIIKELPEDHYCIARLPLLLGVNSPAVVQLQQAIKHHAEFEIYPNVIISANTLDKMAQQVHYLVNQNRSGIYHLASNDMLHHADVFEEISLRLSHKKPIFKSVFQSNEDSYSAILPKYNLLPKNYHITMDEILADSTLNEAITTLKKKI